MLILVNKFIKQFIGNYFDSGFELRIQAFNLLGCAGIAISIISAGFSLLTYPSIWHCLLNLTAAFLGIMMMRLVRRTGKYQLCSLFTVIVVFIIIFPILFFTGYGYKGSMPCFFIFAIVFTALMLESTCRTVMISGEFILYAACCIIQYFSYANPSQTAEYYDMTEKLAGFTSVGMVLYVVILMYIRIYNRQQKRLMELDKLKTEFLSNVSHELKTPLAVMLSVAQNARHELEIRNAGDSLIADMKLLASENQRVALMVTQILDAARIEENNMIWNMRECTVSGIIQTTKATYYPLLKKGGNRLVIHSCENLPPVYADPDRISQVLVNLLQNAIRHTQNGQITISAETHESFARISVTDTGEGIEAERLPFIFERFKSRDSDKKTRDRRDTGTGLGLYICKYIVENHGGTITVRSEIGRGTTVRFTIPLHQEAE